MSTCNRNTTGSILPTHATRVSVGRPAAASAARPLAALLSSDGFFRRRGLRRCWLRIWILRYAQSAAPRSRRHFSPKAKSVIFLFMYGGPSHIDTFDYKPNDGRHGRQDDRRQNLGRGGHKNEGRIVEPRWKFQQHGECGKWVSDLFPHLGELRRRHRVPALDDRRVADPWLGDADDELGQAAKRQPVRWGRGSTTAWARSTRTCRGSS